MRMKSIKAVSGYLEKRLVKFLMPESPPVFIVGCGHSGTSLLLAILGSHSRIYPVPYESKLGYKPVKKYYYLWKFKNATKAMHKFRWVEKTPKHIFRIEELLNLAPDVKILIILRDGRDVAVSYKERFGDIKQGIDAWVSANLAGQKYWNHPRVMLLKYEDLVTNIENTMEEILDFIKEDFESGILRYHEKPKYFYSNTIEKPETSSGQNHKQYRNWQVNQPLFDGRGRWQSISREEKNLIKATANDLLLETGYIENPDW